MAEKLEVFAAEIGESNTVQEVKVRTTGATVNIMAFTARRNGHDDFTTVSVHPDKDAEIQANMVSDFVVAQVGEVKLFLSGYQAAALALRLWRAGN